MCVETNNSTAPEGWKCPKPRMVVRPPELEVPDKLCMVMTEPHIATKVACVWNGKGFEPINRDVIGCGDFVPDYEKYPHACWASWPFGPSMAVVPLDASDYPKAVVEPIAWHSCYERAPPDLPSWSDFFDVVWSLDQVTMVGAAKTLIRQGYYEKDRDRWWRYKSTKKGGPRFHISEWPPVLWRERQEYTGS